MVRHVSKVIKNHRYFRIRKIERNNLVIDLGGTLFL